MENQWGFGKGRTNTFGFYNVTDGKDASCFPLLWSLSQIDLFSLGGLFSQFRPRDIP